MNSIRKIQTLTTGWYFTDTDVEHGESPALCTTTWEKVTVPHDWAISRPINPNMEQGNSQGFLDRWGVGWYRYSIHIEAKKKGHAYLLEFDGVFENCTVYLNGEVVGKNRYGYSGFCLDISDNLIEGENLLALRVDNQTGPVDRWYSGAGIYRNVRLIETGDLRIAQNGLYVYSELSENQAMVTVEVELIHHLPSLHEVTLQATLSRSGIMVGQAASTGEQAVFSIPVENPALWSSDTPNLYALTVSVLHKGTVTDTVSTSIGIRKAEFRPKTGFFINGQPEKLKGVNLHHDAGGLGAAVPKWIWKKRFEILKEMGCNAIRTSHNIPSPEFLDLCDEMGFYVIEESFDKWTAGSYGRYYEEDWQKDLGFMLKRDRNRPSVVIWSVGNEVENQGQDSMIAVLKKLVAYVKETEPHGKRPVTFALIPIYSVEGRVLKTIDEVTDCMVKLAREVDILSCNYHEPWYEDFHQKYPDMLVIGSETFQYFRGEGEERQAFSASNPWYDVEKNGYVAGGFIWTGIEYLGESMLFPSKGWSGGFITTTGFRKPMSYWFESRWSKKPMVHFTVMDFGRRDDMEKEHWAAPKMSSHWSFEQVGKDVMMYAVFSNCQEVEIFLNNKSYGKFCPEHFSNHTVSGYLPYHRGTVKVVGYLDGKAVCEDSVTTAGTPTALQLKLDRETVAAGDVFCAAAASVDEKGTICPNDSHLVHFIVEGEAEIVAVDNGDLLSEESFVGSQRRLFRGGCMAVIRPTAPGRVKVTVCSDGLTPTWTELVAVEV